MTAPATQPIGISFSRPEPDVIRAHVVEINDLGKATLVLHTDYTVDQAAQLALGLLSVLAGGA
ncbi:hypothetical protein [Rhodococcoides fascians]|uniref:hypothetical protein n=1 Tax=Rhodococcoides fascians TaxID=1828 RepID=UPI00056731E7|nr:MULTISPECIES: hypothetical protein [Rhodococcus]OZC50552.1 hypothetical protein CH289_16125 [Rhodococcus sp. RS1C4]OZD65120.1 hypothetical protein CH263_13330 [Rhodococcus sp. 06-1059B-a]OZE98111.1 hypothetical protein CH301_17360 [Rhodococcus sp. 15-1189-1-1a]OZF12761.1 hypothetical protein CH299_18045 [Rhodococcus sp. 14-2686-1-2]